MHPHTMGLQPLAIGLAPGRAGAGAADIAQIGPAFNQQAPDQQLRALVATEGDSALDRGLGQSRPNGWQHGIFNGIDAGLRHLGSLPDGLQPGFGAVVPHRGRADDGPSGGLKFTD